MSEPRTASVWDIFIPKPPKEEAHIKVRTLLMTRLQAFVAEKKMNQTVAVKYFGVNAVRISDLYHSRVQTLTLDSLVKMLHTAGIDLEIQMRPRKDK